MNDIWYRLRLVSPSRDTFKDGQIQLLSKPLLGTDALYAPVKSWPCRSGIKSAQGVAHCWESNRGHIPPSRLIKGVYHVNLDHYYSRLSQSEAFAITPNPIYPLNPDPSNLGQKRTELMIHRDAGKGIGSNGCCVIYDYADRVDDEDLSVNFNDFLLTMDTEVRPIVGNLIEFEVLPE